MSSQTQPEIRKPLGTGRSAMIAALLGAVIFVCFNVISSQVFSNARIDFTQQHLYTLSQGTHMLLGELQETVRFRFFISSGLTRQAPQLAAFTTRVRSLLDSYVAASQGKIILEVIDPRPFSEAEDRAVAFGISSFNGAGGERLFFGLVATNSTKAQSTIRVFAPGREAFLEYDLTRLVSELGRRGKPVVALLDGLGLAGNPATGLPEQQVLTQSKQFFDVRLLSGEIEKLPDDTRVLMVVHPRDLGQKTLYTIDQWVMAGNATIIFVDPFAETQFGPPDGPLTNRSSNLEPLFKAWGVKFDTEHTIGDSRYALQTERDVGGRSVAAQNPAWMALRGDALARGEAVLAQLSTVLMTTAGAFEITKNGVALHPLLRASNAAVTMNALVAGDRRQDPRRLIAEAANAPKPPVLAARLTGTLNSAYPNGLNDEGKAVGSTLKKSAKAANVILVGDVDMLMDRNWVQIQSMPGQQVAQSFANNGDFVVNAIEQMSGGTVLSDLRGRGVSWRPFELIRRMEAEADSRFRAKERELNIQLQETEQKLSKVPKASGGSNEALTEEQAKAIEGFRSQLLAIRSELREVQFALRRDVDNLKNVVTALNVGIVPVVIGVVALFFGMRRPQRPLPRKPSTSPVNEAQHAHPSGGDDGTARVALRTLPALPNPDKIRISIMDSNHLKALAALAAISIAITTWVSRTGAPTAASDRHGESVVPSLLANAKDITGISIRDGADTFLIERRDSGFVASDSGYPVKNDAVGEVVASTAGLTFEEARTSDSARYGDLGLADSGAKNTGKEITFRTAGGELASLLVGNSDTTVGGQRGGVFIRQKGQPRTYLARGSVRLPPRGRSGWFVPISFDVKRSEIRKLELAGGGRDSVTLLPDPGKRGGFVLADVLEKRTPDNLQASLLPSFVDSFTFEDVRRATKPDPDARRMVVEVEGMQIVFAVLGELTEGWVHITAEVTEDAAKDKATLINSKVEGYDFRLPSGEAGRLGWTITDLSVEQKG